MRVLVVGSGGREHALVWKLQQSPECREIFIWPGNPASLKIAKAMDLDGSASYDKLADVAKAKEIDLVIVGPEAPLSSGVADVLTKHGLKVFGPNKMAAQLESSKVFAKKMMTEASIPTAGYEVVLDMDTCREVAMRTLLRDGGVVLKASGLASGKGVFVCKSEADINEGIERLYGPSMKGASEQVVVEEMLFGREVSYFCFIGNDEITRIGFAVDHKRLLLGDKGPNTGGMGCYAPVPWLPEDAGDQVDAKVVNPLLETLSRHGMTYTGVLYVGVMWSDRGPSVVEFNVRFGDPEAQVLAMADQTDWLPLMASKVGLKVKATLQSAKLQPTLGYILASSGYPFGESPDVDAVIPWSLIESNSKQKEEISQDSVRVFAAGVKPDREGIKTGSGRVFLVGASGKTFCKARDLAVAKVHELLQLWPHAQWRSDIGQTVLFDELSKRATANLPIILGSSSPRRRELLGNLGLAFEVLKPETPEVPNPGETPENYVARNAREKSQWIVEHIKDQYETGVVVITADTIVFVDGKILEKPSNPKHADEMLRALSNNKHEVLTAVRIVKVSAGKEVKNFEFTSTTTVFIKQMSDVEIDSYIATGEPFDKAGGYAAQGLGSFMVKEIRGSFSNVVGLPLAELSEVLQRDFGIKLFATS